MKPLGPTSAVARHILVVTGASGAGKTAAVRAVEARALAGVGCFYFDSIGVPSAEVMERDFGGGDKWQAHATAQWLSRLDAQPDAVHVAVLDGQTRPSVVFDAASVAPTTKVHIALLDCSTEVRADRLRAARRQPELANDRMNNWAAYLRGQGDALRVPIVDTTTLSIDEVAEQLAALIRLL
jgi:RNase adaptor protein for sRNA GlmZ degradation